MKALLEVAELAETGLVIKVNINRINLSAAIGTDLAFSGSPVTYTPRSFSTSGG